MRKAQEAMPAVRERLVMLEHEHRTASIFPVAHVNHERIMAGDLSVPREDAREYISPEGIVFVVNAPEWYVQETRHLATVEMSNVIRQTVNYQRPGAATPTGSPFLKILPWLVAAALAILWAVKP